MKLEDLLENKDFQAKVIEQFLNQLKEVFFLQEWLLSTASHLRMGIVSGDVEPRFAVMAEYYETLAADLAPFLKRLRTPPAIASENPPEAKVKPVEEPEPVINVKSTDPSVN